MPQQAVGRVPTSLFFHPADPFELDADRLEYERELLANIDTRHSKLLEPAVGVNIAAGYAEVPKHVPDLISGEPPPSPQTSVATVAASNVGQIEEDLRGATVDVTYPGLAMDAKGGITFSSFVETPSLQMGTFDHGLERNIRVTDPAGQPSHFGLLEMRVGDHFGTVCGANREAVDVACHALGYQAGVLPLSPCGDYGGTDHCGAATAPVAVKNLHCTGSELDVSECKWETPSESCDHSNDVIVYCSNGNMTQPEGSVRLLDAAGAPSTDGIGRLEVYRDGTWAPVCGEDFTTGSAVTACRQMGFEGADVDPVRGCRDVHGEDMCGDKPPHATLACDGTEENVSKCASQGRDDVFCTPQESVVIKCKGHGDPAGLPHVPTQAGLGDGRINAVSLLGPQPQAATPHPTPELLPDGRVARKQLLSFLTDGVVPR